MTGVEIRLAIGGSPAVVGYPIFGLLASASGVLIGGLLAMAMDRVRLDRSLTGGFDPLLAWRNAVGLGLMLGGATGLPFHLVLAYLLWAGAAFGFAGTFVLSLQSWLRYRIAISIMKLRQRLPWRLGAFRHRAAWQASSESPAPATNIETLNCKSGSPAGRSKAIAHDSPHWHLYASRSRRPGLIGGTDE